MHTYRIYIDNDPKRFIEVKADTYEQGLTKAIELLGHRFEGPIVVED